MPSGGEFALLGNASGNRGHRKLLSPFCAASQEVFYPGRANVRQGRAGRLGAEIDLNDKGPARGLPFVLHNAVQTQRLGGPSSPKALPYARAWAAANAKA